METTASPGSRWARAASWGERIGLLVLCYAPFLLSSRGRVSADSKQYLYLDPGDFLARAPYLWDDRVGAGTVSHQHIGYLFPMGPWFWLMDLVDVPVWVAQRLWLGTVSLAAVLGARWLFRQLGLGPVGALAGALVYLLAPYQLAFTARASVLLLPWAGLPWLMGLTDRALRRGGWRDPAAIALVVLAIGAVNASSLVLVGIGPLLWLLAHITSRERLRQAAAVGAKVGLLGTGVSLWWVAALRLEAAYGLPVLHVTENLQSVAATSSPLDVMRGLGNWFFYGRDRLGFSIDQAEAYLTDRWTRRATYALPALALAAAVVVRWRHRGRFLLLVAVGTVVSVGAWPLDDPSPVARGVAEFTDTSAGLALRNTARAVPLVVLGLAGLLGAAVSSVRPDPLRWGAGGLVGLVALAGLQPVARTGFLSENQDRVEPIPGWWHEVADDLEAAGSTTRVLELPGSNFAAHRWGNAVDPILPGLMTRGQVAREVLPLGSPSSALLLDAFDRRLQEGVFEPEATAPVARLFGAGDVLVRSDLQYERFRTPQPRTLWTLVAAGVEGLAAPVEYGPGFSNRPLPWLPELDEVALRTSSAAADPPAVARFEVEDPVPIVRTAPVERPIVLSGDGDGIVDAAAAGLVDGRALVLQAASLDDGALAQAIDDGADLVLTDTYRRRIQTWFYAIRDTRGPTERSGETLAEPTGYDYRIDPSPQRSDAWRTVVEHEGATVSTTAGGGASRPEDRGVVAFDGDLATAWRVGGADPTGAHLTVRADAPVPTDSIVLVQPQDGPRDRVLTAVRLRIDGGPPIDVALDERSLAPTGQAVPLPVTSVREVEIELGATTVPPFDPALANAVGFAEVSIGELGVRERVRVPVALLDSADGGSGRRLDIVLTRLRYEPGARGRQDQERTLERLVELPGPRTFGIAGTARVQPNAPDAVLDEVLGTDLAGVEASATSHLAGDLGSRASRALDGKIETAWRPAFGPQEEQALTLAWPVPATVGDLSVVVRDDERHSVPTRLRLEADGEVVATAELSSSDGSGFRRVTVPSPPEDVRELRIVVDAVEVRTPVPGDLNPTEVLPVAIVELAGTGIPEAVDADEVPDTCRSLLTVDGNALDLRVEGSAGAARQGLSLVPCADEDDRALSAAGGDLEIASAPGLVTGLDIDRLVLSSGPAGEAAPVEARGAPRTGGPALRSSAQHHTESRAQIDSDGTPFWFVLGQSDNAGWEITIDGGTAGPRQVVDGFANGWRIEPSGPGLVEVGVRWAPQRLVWVSLGISVLATLACVVLVIRRRERTVIATVADPASWRWSAPEAPVREPGTVALAAGVGLLGLVIATPAAAVAALGAVLLASWAPRAAVGLAVVAPLAIPLALLRNEPRWAWVALAVVVGDGVARWWTARRSAQLVRAAGR